MRSFTSSRPVVVGVEDAARLGHVELVLGRRRPRAGRRSCRATCGSSRARGSARTCARAGRARARRPCAPVRAPARRRRALRSDRVRRLRRPPSPSSLRIAASCWRNRNSRWRLLHAFVHVTPDRLAHRLLRRGCPWPKPTTSSSRASTSSSLEHLRPSDRRTGRGSSRRGRRPRDGSVVSRTAAISPPMPRDSRMFDDRGLVFACEFLGACRCRRCSPRRGRPAPTARSRCRAHRRRSCARYRPRTTSARLPFGKSPAVFDVGDGAYRRVGGAHRGHDQELAVVAHGLDRGASLVGLEGDGDEHPGQQDPGAQRQNRKGESRRDQSCD